MTACSMPPVYWSTGSQSRRTAGSNGRLVVVRAQVAELVPRRNPRRCPSCRSRARPARRRCGQVVNVQDRVQLERAISPVGRKSTSSGSSTGSWSSGTGTSPHSRAVDDRDRRAPVALAADQPVAQAVGDRALARARAPPASRSPRARSGPRRAHRRAVNRAGVDHDAALAGVGGGHRAPGRGPSPVRRRDHRHDGQAELAGEVKVALVVRGHGHDRAGAVAHQHVVGDPDRDALAVDRVDGVGAGEDAGLFLVVGQRARSRSGAPPAST